jgi:HAD superfamily hydrolase (TIGR01549 family)
VSRRIAWVVFDLGETLVDETASWDGWADYLGVPRFTFHAVMGHVIAAGRPHTDVFSFFRPGFDFAAERAKKEATGLGWLPRANDLYADAIPTLALLHAQGYRLAVFANQPGSAARFMATLPVDRVGTSEQWGIAKPDPRFFERIATTLETAPPEIAYVGDRVDNDVVPAAKAGMLAIHLRRGPWGFIQASWCEPSQAAIRIDSLTELPAALEGWQRSV